MRGLRQLIADDALRVELGRKAAHSIRERYSVQAVLTLWDALFAQVGARAAPPAARRPGMAGIGGTANGAATRSKLDLREPALEKSRRVNEEPT